MRRWTILLACAVAALAVAMSATGGQGKSLPREFCFAPSPGAASGGVSWRIAGQSSANGSTPESATVGRLLSGTWEILSVGLEGVEKPYVHRWVIRLVNTDSVGERNCPLGPCRGSFTFPAAGQVLRKGLRFDSLAAARNRRRTEDDVAVSYNPTQNTLSLSVGPLVFDAGDTYDIAEFEDTTFAGRWESAGFAYAIVKRGEFSVLEKPAGYFCARRIPD